MKSSTLERITARRAPWFSLFILSMVMQNQYLAAASNLVVQTKSGAIQGVNFGSVNQWRGIPYATAPVGNLRWRVPDSTYTLDGHPRWLLRNDRDHHQPPPNATSNLRDHV